MLILLSFILIVYFGYLFSNLIIKDLPLLERVGLSYLLGIGIITQLMFLSSWAGMKITLVSVLATLSVLIISLLLINKLLKRKIEINLLNLRENFRNLKLCEKIICLIIGFIFLLSFSLTLYYPVYIWDALALYDFTAKIIAQTGYFVQIANQFSYFAHYPLLVSLTHTIVYLSGGNNPQFAYSLFFLSFTLIFFSVIRRKSSRLVALLATLLLVTNSRLFTHSTIAYTNLPYTVFYVTGIVYLYFALIRERLDYLLMSSLLIGLSTWARALEPLWITEVFIVFVYSIYKKSIYPILVFLPSFLIIRQPWNIFQTRLFGEFYSTSSQFASIGRIFSSGLDIRRMLDVSRFIYVNMISSWGPIFILFLVVVFFDLKNHINKTNLIMLLIILANFLALSLGTYIFSLRFEEWGEIADSAVRMSMFFPPLMIFYIARALSKSK